MRHNQLDRELSLMLMLTESKPYTVEQLCERLDISRRSLYYYLEFFKDYGFTVEKRGPHYRLDRNSPFFAKLLRTVHFTEDEAVAMRRLLDRADSSNIQVRHLKQKLDRFYDLGILGDVELREQMAACVGTLYEAIKQKNKVVIHGYSSSHSGTRADRVVEPFLFLSDNSEVRCYEMSSRMNKTFKVARMTSVEMLADGWEHEDCHRQMFTDIFMFSGEERTPVTLRLDRVAYNLLGEEHPAARPLLAPDGGSHWQCRLEVCSLVGVGRFVMGLLDHIEIIEGDSLKDYIGAKVSGYRARLDSQATPGVRHAEKVKADGEGE